MSSFLNVFVHNPLHGILYWNLYPILDQDDTRIKGFAFRFGTWNVTSEHLGTFLYLYSQTLLYLAEQEIKQ